MNSCNTFVCQYLDSWKFWWYRGPGLRLEKYLRHCIWTNNWFVIINKCFSVQWIWSSYSIDAFENTLNSEINALLWNIYHRSLKAIVGNENWSESRPFSLFNSIPIKTPATAKIKAKTIVIAVTTPLWSGGGSNSCIAVGLLPTSEMILGWLVSAFFVIIELNSLWALLVTGQNILVINDQRYRDLMIHVPCHLGGF